MMICSALVFFMTPGLAFFYGGLVRRKNVVNTMMACVSIMGLAVVMWVAFGYSLAFGGNYGGIIGDFRWAFLHGINMSEAGPYADSIPHLVYIAFQMMFAIITPALITGSLVGRMKFKALFFFIALWSVVVYYPLAHMVWGKGGLLATIGSVDFAGGNVVHISSGITALTLAILLGRRKGYNKVAYRVHNIPFVVLGAANGHSVIPDMRMGRSSGRVHRSCLAPMRVMWLCAGNIIRKESYGNSDIKMKREKRMLCEFQHPFFRPSFSGSKIFLMYEPF